MDPMRLELPASLAKFRFSHLLFFEKKNMFETTTRMEFLLDGLVVSFLGGGGEFLFFGAAVFFGVT